MMTGTSTVGPIRDSVIICMKSEPFGQSLRKALEASGCPATAVTTELAALMEADTNVPSLILLDHRSASVMNFRRVSKLSSVPIVTVQEEHLCCPDEECLQEYDQGIDLAVCGQSVREVVARVRAILRRRKADILSNIRYSAGKLRMDVDRHEVLVNGQPAELTPREFQILRQFLESPHRVFSRQEMLNRVWGEGYALEEHALDVHIHSLRRKIEQNPAEPKFLHTVRGIGYKLRV